MMLHILVTSVMLGLNIPLFDYMSAMHMQFKSHELFDRYQVLSYGSGVYAHEYNTSHFRASVAPPMDLSEIQQQKDINDVYVKCTTSRSSHNGKGQEYDNHSNTSDIELSLLADYQTYLNTTSSSHSDNNSDNNKKGTKEWRPSSIPGHSCVVINIPIGHHYLISDSVAAIPLWYGFNRQLKGDMGGRQKAHDQGMARRNIDFIVTSDYFAAKQLGFTELNAVPANRIIMIENFPHSSMSALHKGNSDNDSEFTHDEDEDESIVMAMVSHRVPQKVMDNNAFQQGFGGPLRVGKHLLSVMEAAVRDWGRNVADNSNASEAGTDVHHRSEGRVLLDLDPTSPLGDLLHCACQHQSIPFQVYIRPSLALHVAPAKQPDALLENIYSVLYSSTTTSSSSPSYFPHYNHIHRNELREILLERYMVCQSARGGSGVLFRPPYGLGLSPSTSSSYLSGNVHLDSYLTRLLCDLMDVEVVEMAQSQVVAMMEHITYGMMYISIEALLNHGVCKVPKGSVGSSSNNSSDKGGKNRVLETVVYLGEVNTAQISEKDTQREYDNNDGHDTTIFTRLSALLYEHSIPYNHYHKGHTKPIGVDHQADPGPYAFLAVATKAYISIYHNYLCSLAQIYPTDTLYGSVRPLVVITPDKEICGLSDKYRVGCLLVTKEDLLQLIHSYSQQYDAESDITKIMALTPHVSSHGTSFEFGTITYQLLMLVRTLVTLTALEGHISIIICDIDTVWQIDPLLVIIHQHNEHNRHIHVDNIVDKDIYHNHHHFSTFDIALTLDSAQEFCGCFIVLNNRYVDIDDNNGEQRSDGKAGWRFWAEVTKQHVALLAESLQALHNNNNNNNGCTNGSRSDVMYMPSYLESEQKIITRLLSTQWNPAYFQSFTHEYGGGFDPHGTPDVQQVSQLRKMIRQKVQMEGVAEEAREEEDEEGADIRGQDVLQFARLRVRVLPQSAFPSGYDYFNARGSPTSRDDDDDDDDDDDGGGDSNSHVMAAIIHNNHMIGMAAKESRFKRFGLWNLINNAEEKDVCIFERRDDNGSNAYDHVLGAVSSKVLKDKSITTLNIVSPIHRSVQYTSSSAANGTTTITHLLSMERPEAIPSYCDGNRAEPSLPLLSVIPTEVHTWLNTPYPAHFRSLLFSLLNIPLKANYVSPDRAYSTLHGDSGGDERGGASVQMLEVQPFTSIVPNTNIAASTKVLHVSIDGEGPIPGGSSSTLSEYWGRSLEYVLHNQRLHSQDWGLYYNDNDRYDGHLTDYDEEEEGEEDGVDKEVFVFRIIVLAYDRPTSLNRLLRSLLLAEYNTANEGNQIHLDIHIDGAPVSTPNSDSDGEKEQEDQMKNIRSSLGIARKLHWPYGKKRVTARAANRGLAYQWLHCWRPRSNRYAPGSLVYVLRY